MLIKSTSTPPALLGRRGERGQPRAVSRQEAAPITTGMSPCQRGLIEQPLLANSKVFSTGSMDICF